MQHPAFYVHGSHAALATIGLTKNAFMGAVSKRLAPYGASIERGVTSGIGRVFGPHGKGLAKELVKGTPAEVAKQTALGAGLGGLLEGGMAAASSDEGEGWKSFGKGFGSGALSGAGVGALSGAVTAPAQNIRRLSLMQRAKGQGIPVGRRAALAKEQYERGFFGSAKDLYTGKGPLGRGGAAENMLGGVGQLASEIVIPMSVVNAVSEEPQPPRLVRTLQDPLIQQYNPLNQKTGEEDPRMLGVPPRLLISIGGGTTGGITAGMLADTLAEKGHLPAGLAGTALKRLIPAAGSIGGSIAGFNLGEALYHPTPPEKVNT